MLSAKFRARFWGLRRELLRNRGELAGGFATVGVGRERLEEAFGGDGADQKVGSAGAHCSHGQGDAVTVR